MKYYGTKLKYLGKGEIYASVREYEGSKKPRTLSNDLCKIEWFDDCNMAFKYAYSFADYINEEVRVVPKGHRANTLRVD